MGKDVEVLKDLVRDYVEDRIAFWPFHNSFIEVYVRLPERALKESERKAWDQVYKMVLVSAPDPVTPEDQTRGIIGAVGLKSRLGALPLLRR
jgi:hypothetical protein